MASSKNTNETQKSDWDDEDDSWDDWGDAEDIAPAEVSQEINAKDGAAAISKVPNKGDTEISNKTAEQPKYSESLASAATPRGSVSSGSSNQTQPSPGTPKGGVWGMFGGSGLGSVVSSVFSTASEGLGNLSSTVSQGLNQVIGVPDPEELARMHIAEESAKPSDERNSKDLVVDDKNENNKVEKSDEKHEENNMESAGNVKESIDTPKDSNTPSPSSASASGFGLGLVTTLGSKVINTGLDTLEGIGKKTISILQENDARFTSRRTLLGLEPDAPLLSQVLREAKDDAEEVEKRLAVLRNEQVCTEHRFEVIFENNCGLVHLEALEILSKESSLRLENLREAISGNALTEFEETLVDVQMLMDGEECFGDSVESNYSADELKEKLVAAIEEADLQINFDEIINKWLEFSKWAKTANTAELTEQDIYVKTMLAIGETCALEMAKLHKIAELLLVKEHHSTATEVDAILKLYIEFSTHLNGIHITFYDMLRTRDSEESKTLIARLSSEMMIGRELLKKSLNLFLPIMQIGAV